MNYRNSSNKVPHLKALVSDLLKIDPGTLASLGAKAGVGYNTKAGLHEFMREVVERSLSLLWAPNEYKLLLQTEDGARAMGYDAKVLNLLQLCSMALVRMPRRKRGLGDLVLCEAPANVVELSQQSRTRKPRRPVVELVAAAGVLFEPDFDAIRDAPGLDASSMSIKTLVDEMLGVDPATLIGIYYDNKDDARQAYLRDPDGQALAGLSAMLTRILFHFPMIINQGIDKISFLLATNENYSDAEGVAATNLGALLTLGLLADGKRDVAFVA